MKVIQDSAALSKLVGSIVKASGKLTDDIQQALQSVVYFAAKDGNIDTLNTLFVTVAKSVRRAAIRSWVLEFAPVTDNPDKEAIKTIPFKFSREKLETLTGHNKPTPEQALAYAQGLETLWTEYKEVGVVPEEVDIHAIFASALKKVEGTVAKGAKIKGAALLENIRSVLAHKEDPTGADPLAQSH